MIETRIFMVTAINYSTSYSAGFSSSIEHKNTVSAFIKTDTQPILPASLTILPPEIIKDHLIYLKPDDKLQNKQNFYFYVIEGSLNDIKNGNREIDNGIQNIINGKINKDQTLIKNGQTLLEQGQALRDNGLINFNRLLSDENPAPVAKSYQQSHQVLLAASQQKLTQAQHTLDENSYHSLIVMFNDIQQTIRDANKSYLHSYRDVFKNSMEKFQEISGLLSEVSNYVNESSKDNFITLKQQKILDDFQQLKTKLSQEPDGIIYQQEIKFIQHADGDYQKVGDDSDVRYTEAQVLALMQSYRQSFEQKVTGTLIEAPNLDQINANSLTQGITIKIKIDIKLLERVIEVVKNLQQPTRDNLEISQARFNLINTAIDTTKKDYQAMLDEMSQRYNAANANYDNFVKILSSTINAMLDSAKSFLR